MARTDSEKTARHEKRPRRLLPVAERESLIVSVAAELFLEHGFTGMTIDSIMAIAGGSKRDIYNLFGDKETLFERCVAMLMQENTASLKLVVPGDDLKDNLKSVSLLIIDIFLQPRTLALHKLIVANADRAQSASKSFLEGGPQRVYSAIAELLKHYSRLGLLEVSDPLSFAKVLVGGLTAELQIRSLMGEVIGVAERETKADFVVENVLKGIHPRA